MDLSVVIPVHNEESKLNSQLVSFMENFDYKGDFEIVLCENGSTDSTLELAKKMAQINPNIKVVVSPQVGIGRALSLGFNCARGDRIFVTGLDFPFGFSALTTSLSNFEKGKITINSKFHNDSTTKIPIQRRIISFVYRLLLFLLFGSKTRDPQGSFLVGREEASMILRYCPSPSSFFETQFILYGKLLGYKIEELPVNFVTPIRHSRFNIPKEIVMVTLDVLREVPIYYLNKYRIIRGIRLK